MMINSTQFFSGLAGFTSGTLMANAKREEDTIKQGTNQLMAFKPQATQIALALGAMSDVSEQLANNHWLASAGFGTVTLLSQILGVGGAAMAALIKNGGDENQILTLICKKFELDPKRVVKIATLVTNHAGNVAQVAFAVATVAKFALGNQIEATVSLVVMGIGVLDRKGFLPEKVSVIVQTHFHTIALAGAVLTAPLLLKITSLILLISKVSPIVIHLMDRMQHDWILPKLGVEVTYPLLSEIEGKPAADGPKWTPTAQQVLDFDVETSLDINFNHVRKERISIVGKEENPEGLLGIFDAIDWKLDNNFKVLESKLKDDDRWKELKFGEESVWKSWNKYRLNSEVDQLQNNSDNWKNDCITWTRAQLDLFCQNINGKKRAVGGLSGWDVTCKKARIITSLLNNDEHISNVDKQDAVLSLAIDGGDYCTTGISSAVKIVFSSMGAGEQTLEQKVLTLLHQEREIRFQYLFELMKHFSKPDRYQRRTFSQEVLKNAVKGAQDRHYFNDLMLKFGRGIGLDLVAARQDAGSQHEGLWNEVFSLVLPHIRQGFWSKRKVEGQTIAESIQGMAAVVLRINGEERETYAENTEDMEWGPVKVYHCAKAIIKGISRLWLATFHEPSFQSLFCSEPYNQEAIVKVVSERGWQYVQEWKNDYIKRVANTDEDKSTLETQFDDAVVDQKLDKWSTLMLIDTQVFKTPALKVA